MGRKGMSAQERREYERLQERKKQRLERQQARTMESNPAKSSPGRMNRMDEKRKVRRPDRLDESERPERQNKPERQNRPERLNRPDRADRQEGLNAEMRNRQTPRRNNRRRRPERAPKNILGNILLMLQAIVSVAFLAVLVLSNIIPMKFIVIVGICLLLLLLIGAVSQWKRRKKGTIGKVYIMLVTLVVGLGAYYLGITTGALAQITGGNKTVDTMVVAVLADDPAENLADAESYRFGVQYHMSGDDMKDTVKQINKDLGSNIEEVEFKNVNAQAKALHDGEVDAIIYNEGYKGILEDEFDGYSDKVKIIYTHHIETQLEDISIDVDVTEPFSVYISGIDVYGEITQNSRSDVNIIATVNPKTRQILLVTTPRDYYVEIPEISNGQKDKLTHAGIYGIDASIRTLSELYDVEIPFYARVNFTSLIDIVDILGGVDVVSEYEFTTSKAAGKVVEVKEGLNHFNGEEALAFSRERKKVPDGDNQRGKNQQAVLTAMIKKVVSPSILLKANSILSSVSGNVETNMSQRQLQALIKRQLSVGGSWNIKSVAAEGIGDQQACYSSGRQELYVTIPDEESVASIQAEIDRVMSGETLDEGEMTE